MTAATSLLTVLIWVGTKLAIMANAAMDKGDANTRDINQQCK